MNSNALYCNLITTHDTASKCITLHPNASQCTAIHLSASQCTPMLLVEISVLHPVLSRSIASSKNAERPGDKRSDVRQTRIRISHSSAWILRCSLPCRRVSRNLCGALRKAAQEASMGPLGTDAQGTIMEPLWIIYGIGADLL